jgi:hypothetical protein
MQTLVIGAVEYRINAAEAGVINARYLSTASMQQASGKICLGKAIGDTSNGFPGTYVIQYFGTDGELVGEFDWSIARAGDGYRLTWRNRGVNRTIPVQEGDVVFEGFGFPNSEDSIVVTYWMSEQTSMAMMAAAANGRST